MSLGDSATPLGRVEGLGSARHGGEHWLAERVTSAALLLLGAWLIASLLFLPSLDQRTLAEWLGSASGAVPMALFVVAAFKHALDGLKVVVDDYVPNEANRFALNTLLLFAAIGGASLALFAIGRIAFGGAA
jgi:succinate dehydrogenase / fumarate reductase membrane anchor subunit